MPNVRGVFERAYGPVPDGATCHSAWGCELDAPDAPDYGPGLRLPLTDVQLFWDGYAWADNEDRCCYGPDISDRDAEAFRGFFGDDYDAALDALTKEESATAINRTMRKYDLALHKLAKFSEVTKAQPDPRKVIALADAMAVEFRWYVHGNNQAVDRYMEASREFWAALSADGTGESPVLSTHLDVMGEGK